MRVEKISSSSSKVHKLKEKPPAGSASFSSFMHEKRDEQDREALGMMIKKIKEKGEELVDSRNLDILVNYKRMVKGFVEQAANYAFAIIDRKGMSRQGRSKILKIVSQIDESLVQITEDFLSEERNKLELLKKIGQLGGLLTDIYM